ncbi:hypothetical protein [Acidisoma cladoniae]|uniref:hypothetical protein n=1 Tax=Acidisoma cladoniae TaxID=3040935 RepID=UPI0025518A21|nr:hypothetical protein [Acidisoma sp. PAMC 29798]
MPRESSASQVSFAPIRIAIGVVLAFVALIVVLLIVRPSMMYSMLHDVMAMM